MVETQNANKARHRKVGAGGLSQTMKYLDLLGKQLKSDDVIEVLERDDLDVIYAFDHLHENQPDE